METQCLLKHKLKCYAKHNVARSNDITQSCFRDSKNAMQSIMLPEAVTSHRAVLEIRIYAGYCPRPRIDLLETPNHSARKVVTSLQFQPEKPCQPSLTLTILHTFYTIPVRSGYRTLEITDLSVQLPALVIGSVDDDMTRLKVRGSSGDSSNSGGSKGG